MVQRIIWAYGIGGLEDVELIEFVDKLLEEAGIHGGKAFADTSGKVVLWNFMSNHPDRPSGVSEIRIGFYEEVAIVSIQDFNLKYEKRYSDPTFGPKWIRHFFTIYEKYFKEFLVDTKIEHGEES